eukprot:TRINITY_DN1198_c0_g2_i1.p2 TRINITY_DN1198_c0_g2~~TRINITY_DN1198_c0_g2_i1.p2  ORF type:complete len:575 (-),score=237.73 TRINITY_DN1198_c0_g2_i1:268-1992(-)
MALANSAFVFIKPDAVTDKVKDLVKATLKEKGLKIVKQGTLKSEVIDKKKLIDNHYYAIASKATILKPKELNVPADKFKGKFGLEWQAALDSGKVYNAMDGCEFFGIDATEMDKQWAACKKADKLIKFGGGFYCGDISIGDKQAYVFNGFFMSMRAGYVVPGKSIFYYTVQWDPKKLSWAEFREKVCGVTDPAEADAGSIRGQIYAKWEELDLKEKPNVGQNSLHASASPFEGLSEKMNWLNFKCEADDFGAALLEAGLPLKVIKDWCKDPQVEVGGKKGSCYDALEDMDAGDCLAKCKDLWMLNRPPVVGKVSGETYDFQNTFAKILAGKEKCHKIYEDKYILAFLDIAPTSTGDVLVIPKALGFPTFLDMPSAKAQELTRELPKLANALKKAMEATDMTICTHVGAGKQTVPHPKFHLIPVYNGAYKKQASVSDDFAKDVAEKVDAALHPPTPLKVAKFGQVGRIKPEQKGLNLCVKATGAPAEQELPKGGKVYTVPVGDATGSVVLSLTEAQKDLVKADKVYEIRNAFVKMVKGHINIVVDKWGKIESSTEEVKEVNKEKDISETEYELRK